MWLVPSETAATARAATLYEPLADAATELSAGRYDNALSLASRPSLAGSALADYASYYKGLAQLRLDRAADARATFDALQKRTPTGYLAIATSLGEAEAAAALGDHADALAIYEKLTSDKTVVNEQILARQAEEARVLGDRRKTAESLLRIYYEFPLTDAAVAAAAELEPLRDITVRQGYKLDLGRAIQLYGRAAIRMRAPPLPPCRARSAATIASSSISASRNAITSCSGIRPRSTHYNRGSIAARGRPRHVSSRPARSAVSVATRCFSRRHKPLFATFRRARGLKRRSITWAPTTSSRTTTRWLLRRSPSSTRSSPGGSVPSVRRGSRDGGRTRTPVRRNGPRLREGRGLVPAVGLPAAVPVLVGAVARETRRGRRRAVPTAPHCDRLRQLVLRTPGGPPFSRNAQTTLVADAVPAARQSPPRPADPANAGVIRLLLASELYDDALNELRFAQRSSGSSPVIDATIAWAYYRKGELRRAITLMRRAYPQHLTADQSLPRKSFR